MEELTVQNVIIGDVRSAASAAVDAARQRGFQAELLTAHLEGEAREVGKVAGALARDLGRGCAWILGGETTVTVRGQGVGGRNQELALAACLAIEGSRDRVIASFATDGEDGPTEAAGAVVTGETAIAARTHGLDPVAFLQDNDSHTFFLELADKVGHNYLLNRGPTGTNVNDLLIILHPEHGGEDSPEEAQG
jgi:hydroxypyruvate reductase